MNVPKTSSGKDCKLCLKKGSKCHLHGGTPGSPKSPKRSPNAKSGSFDSALGSHKKRSSPKRSSPKKSSPKKTGSWTGEDILDLPKPVLYDFLLELSGKKLKELVKIKKVRELVSYPEFKRLYDIRHKVDAFTVGKVTTLDDDDIVIKAKGVRINISFAPGFGPDWMLSVQISFNDSLKPAGRMFDHTIHLVFDYSDENGNTINFSINNISWFRSKNSKTKEWEIEEEDDRHDLEALGSLNELFTLKKKTEWIIKGTKLDKNMIRELFETFKVVLKKKGLEAPDWPIWA